ncbi:hypothetical protein [Xanthocytophaga agilis]|uniref:Uncharacterized protein n=1 Tax=Xanthocytophaga agilis TaxID=3048010 RepID=A0AAE3RDT2_9BACT|nr:hypothetical protein [Xanthocytophaga agilis]MDJ1506137.1 hypothetical protein [Xanthocytophaga agilis]
MRDDLYTQARIEDLKTHVNIIMERVHQLLAQQNKSRIEIQRLIEGKTDCIHKKPDDCSDTNYNRWQ